ncbi:MAG: DNA-processing protein DprA [Fibrobacterota bacterium]
MKHCVALSLIPGIGPRRYDALCENFGDAAGIFSAALKDVKKIIPEKCATQINSSLLIQAEKIISWCRSYSISILTRESTHYPRLLKECDTAPFILYVMGDVSALHTPCFSIVGTRNSSEYGIKATDDIAGTAARRGYTIVSGLALGVDCAAHRAALKTGTTIAVLGSGLDTIYPACHRNLARDIAQKGCLITEYPPGMGGKPYMFLQRNRIISALSMATLVVEAGEKSGALSTARHVLEQNRELFSLPGSIYSPRSAGTNRLISDGAKPVLNVSALLEDLYELYKNTGCTPSIFRTPAVSPRAKKPDMTDFKAEERNILELLKRHSSGMRLDQFMEEVHDQESLFETLLSLEMKDAIIQEAGQIYRLKADCAQ